MMKALVTGATGFLGTHLGRALERRGDEVVAVGSAGAAPTIPRSRRRKIGISRVSRLKVSTPMR